MTNKGDHEARGILRRLVSPAFYIIVIVFLILYVRSLDFSILKDTGVSWFFISISLLFAILTRYWSTFIWFTILKGLGAQDIHKNKLQLTFVYAKSWLGRYVPGTAPWILGKIYFASKLGISKNKLAVSSVLEAGLQIVTTLALSLAVLLLDYRFSIVPAELRILAILLLMACLIMMIPTIFNRSLALIYRTVKKKMLPDEDKITASMIYRGTTLYAIGALINGLSLFFIAKGVYPDLPYASMLFIISVGNLAGVLGMMSVFVPSGIGVREGVQLALLAVIMPVEIALVITVATRLMGVVSDLAFYAVALSHSRLLVSQKLN